MRVILEVIQGPSAGEQFVFERREAFVVGRKKNERVQFPVPGDPYLSRYHMLIEISPPHCYLRDIGSTNGTYVNGKKIPRASLKRLKDGDRIRGGRTVMRLRIETGPIETGPIETGRLEPAEPTSQREVVGAVEQMSKHEPVEPLAGAHSAEPVDPDWDTKAFENRPTASGPPSLRCGHCGGPPTDADLGDLCDTRMIGYVCPECRDKLRTPEQPVPNYEKLGTLHRGPFGPVYKARRISTGKLVALKVLSSNLSSNPRAVKLFLREMTLACRLKHPNIVPIVEMGQAGRDLWIASEFVEGVDGRQLAHRLGGTLPLGDAVEILCQALEALDYAHQEHLVHRDVKPSNVLVSGGPGAYLARLSDFGLIRNMDEAGVSGITRRGEVRGTVPFMPPEQVLDCRFVKPAGDVYGAGATLYWLLTGRFVREFDVLDGRGEKKDAYLVILEDPIVPIRRRDPSIPDPIAKVIEIALEKEPEDRYETAAEMARALRNAVRSS